MQTLVALLEEYGPEIVVALAFVVVALMAVGRGFGVV